LTATRAHIANSTTTSSGRAFGYASASGKIMLANRITWPDGNEYAAL
jgi:hypothetical protein